MTKKERVEIPAEVAARVLFLSDRTCCVCRVVRKPVQIHHMDEDPNNCIEENLAVLCFDCHRDTQIRGGFDRKLDASQIVLYRLDWYDIVDRRRHGPESVLDVRPVSPMPQGLTQVHFQGKVVRLSYVQMTEKEEEHRYSFNAEYPEISPNELTSASEVNLSITAFVVRTLQRFRAEAIARSDEKKETASRMPKAPIWDDLSISFDVILFCDDLLALEFRLQSYVALAVHPNSNTKTMNFLLRPYASPLEFQDLFLPDSKYLQFVSDYCIANLHSQLPDTLRVDYPNKKDSWIVQGAAPRIQNFEHFLVTGDGLRIIFDAYQVGSYAEGRREVFIPAHAISKFLREPFVTLLR
jgi:uncharacterized protein DUF3298